MSDLPKILQLSKWQTQEGAGLSSPADEQGEDPHQGRSELCTEDLDTWVPISLPSSVRRVTLSILLNFSEPPVSHLSTEAMGWGASNEVI